MRVRQKRTASTEYSSKQQFLSREMLLDRYPDLLEQVTEIDRECDDRRSKYEAHWLPKLLRSLHLFKKTLALMDRYYPGEFVSMSLRLPNEFWKSERRSGFDRYRSLHKKLFFVYAAPALDATKNKIMQTFDDLPKTSRPRVHVYLVHNHPGSKPLPLSKFDLKFQRHIAQMLASWDDSFDFDFTMIALATLKSPRDVAFVRTLDSEDLRETVKRPPRARPRRRVTSPSTTRR